MSWLSRILGVPPKTAAHTVPEKPAARPAEEPGPTPDVPFAGLEGIRIGRYSDNNKTYAKTAQWHAAEAHYKAKAFPETFAAFFNYLRDDAEDNVHFTPGEGAAFSFEIYQGSKRIRGESDGTRISARAALARMEKPSTAVMRRLLEMNYTLYYTRAAIGPDDQTISLLFDTEVAAANPTKLYHGLRELATKADRQDDGLLLDFAALQPTDTDHLCALPGKETDVKWQWFRAWIEGTLSRIDELNQDSFASAVASMLLALLYRIDFLIVPEGALLTELERINGLYWTRPEDVPLVERNGLIKEAFRKLAAWSREDFAKSVYRCAATFGITGPPKADKVTETAAAAARDSRWYGENKYPEIAIEVCEYGLLHASFVYGLPRMQTALVQVFCAVLHPEYFTALGARRALYDRASATFDPAGVEAAVDAAIAAHGDKYSSLKWNHSRIQYSSLYDFAASFSDQIVHLNLDIRR